MHTPPSTPEELERVRAERLDADRRYNDALTALDAAVAARTRTRLHAIPGASQPPDDATLAALREQARIVPDQGPLPPGGRLRRRAARFLWELLGPFFERQLAFNTTLLDHLTRAGEAQRRTCEAFERVGASAMERHEAALLLDSRLIRYLQEITAYVDTKDREVASLSSPLAAGLSELGDRLARHQETLSGTRHLAMALKRELDRSGAAPLPATAHAPSEVAAGAASLQQTAADPLESYKYVGFEERFRGAREQIRARQAEYLPLFAGASDVLDVGCGRGEFLDLLAGQGTTARGLDLNHEMVELCRARGHVVEEGDALTHLRSLPEGALGGLFAAQVVEHLQPDYLVALLEAAWRVLRPGAHIVLETINPACWLAFFSSYIRDITHVRPLHPDTLSYLLSASGFEDVTVRYSAPCPEELKLQRLPVTDDAAAATRTFNANVERINELLFSYMDYAAIGRR